MVPTVATITISPERVSDGGVNFIISGNHVVTIYDDNTRPEDIDPNLLVPGITTAGGVIDDPDKRIYRGVNETAPTGARDRVEVVHFSKPGTYLVICAVRNHFVNDGMYGFVVVRDDQIVAQ
jgi:plastocyanin